MSTMTSTVARNDLLAPSGVATQALQSGAAELQGVTQRIAGLVVSLGDIQAMIQSLLAEIALTDGQLRDAKAALVALRPPRSSDFTKIETDPATGASRTTLDADAYREAQRQYESQRGSLARRVAGLEQSLRGLRQNLASQEARLRSVTNDLAEAERQARELERRIAAEQQHQANQREQQRLAEEQRRLAEALAQAERARQAAAEVSAQARDALTTSIDRQATGKLLGQAFASTELIGAGEPEPPPFDPLELAARIEETARTVLTHVLGPSGIGDNTQVHSNTCGPLTLMTMEADASIARGTEIAGADRAALEEATLGSHAQWTLGYAYARDSGNTSGWGGHVMKEMVADRFIGDATLLNDFASQEQAVDAVVAALDSGVPVAIGYPRHWVCATDVRHDGENTEVLLHDSWTGQSQWVPAQDLAGGSWVSSFPGAQGLGGNITAVVYPETNELDPESVTRAKEQAHYATLTGQTDDVQAGDDGAPPVATPVSQGALDYSSEQMLNGPTDRQGNPREWTDDCLLFVSRANGDLSDPQLRVETAAQGAQAMIDAERMREGDEHIDAMIPGASVFFVDPDDATDPGHVAIFTGEYAAPGDPILRSTDWPGLDPSTFPEGFPNETYAPGGIFEAPLSWFTTYQGDTYAGWAVPYDHP